MNKVAVVPMDIHKKFSMATPMEEGGKDLGAFRIDHGDREGMGRYFSRFSPGTPVVMEATFNWPWIAEFVEQRGLQPRLADPYWARRMSKKMSKSDKKDARYLGRLFLGGDLFPEAYLAPRPVRMQRALFRTRVLWVRQRVAIKNNIHGQLFRLGVIVKEEVSDLFSPKGRKILARLEMEKEERWILERKLEALDGLGCQIEQIERKIQKHLQADPRASILMSLPGVGAITAYSILAEMGPWQRFANPRALAGYAGLLPLDNESAGKDFGKRAGRHCNKHLHWVMIEAVSGAVKRSPRMRSLHSRVKARHPDTPGKARVAVARELIELAHLLLSRGELYQEHPPARSGSKTAGKTPSKEKS